MNRPPPPLSPPLPPPNHLHEAGGPLRQVLNLHVRLLTLVSRLTHFMSDQVILSVVRDIRGLVHDFFQRRGPQASFQVFLESQPWQRRWQNLTGHHCQWFHITGCIFDFTQIAYMYEATENVETERELLFGNTRPAILERRR